MIIISQDKSEIINFDNTLNICIYPKYDDLDNEIGYEVFAGMKAPDDNYRTLGYYKTEERAKAILNELAIRYALNRMSQSIHFAPGKETPSKYMPAYEMPEK